MYEQKIEAEKELYEAIWQPFPDGAFPEKRIAAHVGVANVKAQAEAKPSAYVPPHARDRPGSVGHKVSLCDA